MTTKTSILNIHSSRIYKDKKCNSFNICFEDVNKATTVVDLSSFFSVPFRKVFKLLKPLLLHLYKGR